MQALCCRPVQRPAVRGIPHALENDVLRLLMRRRFYPDRSPDLISRDRMIFILPAWLWVSDPFYGVQDQNDVRVALPETRISMQQIIPVGTVRSFKMPINQLAKPHLRSRYLFLRPRFLFQPQPDLCFATLLLFFETRFLWEWSLGNLYTRVEDAKYTCLGMNAEAGGNAIILRSVPVAFREKRVPLIIHVTKQVVDHMLTGSSSAVELAAQFGIYCRPGATDVAAQEAFQRFQIVFEGSGVFKIHRFT